MRLIGFLLLSVLAVTVVRADTFDISGFKNANQLIWNEEFKEHISNFFLDQKGSYFWDEATIAEQVISGFGGPSEGVVEVDAGVFFTSACRHHSCPEKSAYVTNGNEELFGVISYLCPTEDGTFYCDQGRAVLFYKSEDALESLGKYLQSWSAKKAKGAELVMKKI